MIFDAPIPFEEADQYQAVKQLLPTSMSSEQLSELPVAIRQRALFSARCTNAGFLQRLDDLLTPALNSQAPQPDDARLKGIGQGKIRALLKEYQDSTDYQAPEGKEGTIEDLSSDARLNLIVKMNVGFAQGYGSWKQGQTEAVMDQYPCQELYRREDRKEPREWLERWTLAGGETYGEGGDYGPRMIARKDDDIWESISAFGLPYAPFDFNSGMDVMDVDRDEAIALGVISEDDEAPEPEDRDLNDDLQAGVEALSALLQGALLQSVGKEFGIVDGLLSLLNEAGGGCLMARIPETVAIQMREFQGRIEAGTLVANEGSRFSGSNFSVPMATFATGWDYLASIRTATDAARVKAAAAATDPDEKNALEKGHGSYYGSCGHKLMGCRCSKAHARIDVATPCWQCSKDAANEGTSEGARKGWDTRHYIMGIVDADAGHIESKEVEPELGNPDSSNHEKVFKFTSHDARWRHISSGAEASKNRVIWTDTPSGNQVDAVEDHLAKKGLTAGRHTDWTGLEDYWGSKPALNEHAAGLEFPHVTICYGFEGVTASELTAAMQELAPDPIIATLGKVMRFPGSVQGDDGADVLVISVDSPQLEALHEALAARFSDRLAAQSHPYTCHSTIAYIQPGTNLQLDGDTTFEGIEVTFGNLVFSQDDVQQSLDTAQRLNEWSNEGKPCGRGFIAAGDTCRIEGETDDDDEKQPTGPIAKPLSLKREGDQPLTDKAGAPLLDKAGNQRSGGGKWVTEAGAEPPQHVKDLVIPPNWRNVVVSADPDADLQAKGIDSKDRPQSVYSDSHDMRTAAAKFARIKELMEKAPAIRAQTEADLHSTDHQTSENAACFLAVFTTGIRPGSDADTGAERLAYGATTLEGRHVIISGTETRLSFDSKKGGHTDIPVTDEATAGMLRARAAKAGPSGRLFDTSNSRLLSYSHTRDGGGFKTKDFRTAIGTRTAIEEVNKMATPKTMEEYRKSMNHVGDIVAARLGNTRKIALDAYIAPEVFAGWRASL